MFPHHWSLICACAVPAKWRWNKIKFRNCENKNVFFPISSMQADKKKKHTEIAQAEMTQCIGAEKEFFFFH